MRRIFVLTLLTAPLVGLPAWAQYGYPPPSPGQQGNGVALVTSWIQRYLQRQPNPLDIQNGQAMDAGTADPTALLAGILGCDEYYTRSGSDDRRFIAQVFTDVAGRPPSPAEETYWFNRLLQYPQGSGGRSLLAYAPFQGYPPNLPAPAPPATTSASPVAPAAPPPPTPTYPAAPPTPPAPTYAYPAVPPPPAPTYEYRRPYY